MSEDVATLAEMMLAADIFCAEIEGRSQDKPPSIEQEELRLKIAQCRGALSQLQGYHDADELTISNPSVRADFRILLIALLWVAFRARDMIDFRLFRRVVQVESAFTLLLINEVGKVR